MGPSPQLARCRSKPPAFLSGHHAIRAANARIACASGRHSVRVLKAVGLRKLTNGMLSCLSPVPVCDIAERHYTHKTLVAVKHREAPYFQVAHVPHQILDR